MSTAPAAPYYRAEPFQAGRWIVTHPVPGLTYLSAIDIECATEAAAVKESARMNALRERALRSGWPCDMGATA